MTAEGIIEEINEEGSVAVVREAVFTSTQQLKTKFNNWVNERPTTFEEQRIFRTMVRTAAFEDLKRQPRRHPTSPAGSRLINWTIDTTKWLLEQKAVQLAPVQVFRAKTIDLVTQEPIDLFLGRGTNQGNWIAGSRGGFNSQLVAEVDLLNNTCLTIDFPSQRYLDRDANPGIIQSTQYPLTAALIFDYAALAILFRLGGVPMETLLRHQQEVETALRPSTKAANNVTEITAVPSSYSMLRRIGTVGVSPG